VWYPPHRPTTKQKQFLALDCLEALFGGAAGGGKSDALLMAALQYVHVPGYAALILRRTFADLALPGAIMDRAKEWLVGTSDAKWNDNTRTFTFPSGATLTFGYLATEVDKFRYQGAELQFIAFDELTQFTETQYRYLFSRLRRREGVGVPLRMRAASNPGGVGHEWVKARFVDPATNEGRVFIPCNRRENPYVDNVAYDAALAALDPTTQKQLDEGDWDVLPPGELFKPEWFTDKGRDLKDIPAGLDLVLFWDTAATEPSATNTDPDWTAGVLVGSPRERDAFYILDVCRFRRGPGDTELMLKGHCAIVRDRMKDYGGKDGGTGAASLIVGIEEEGGSSGKIAARALVTKLAGFTVCTVRPDGDKATRARPAATQAQHGNFYFLKAEWNRAFFDELFAFNGLEPSKGGAAHDDQADALSGAFNLLTRGSNTIKRRPDRHERYGFA
jgi:predicted phage terminase large subunit-like protein